MRFDVGELVSLLSTGVANCTIHHEAHPRVREVAEQFARSLEKCLTESREDGLFLGMVDGRLVSAGRSLQGPTLIAKRLIDAAARLQTGGFLFHKGVSAAEVARFLGLCARRVRGPASLDECRRLMSSLGIRDIAVSPRYGEPGWLGDRYDDLRGARIRIDGSPAGLNDAGVSCGEHAGGSCAEHSGDGRGFGVDAGGVGGAAAAAIDDAIPAYQDMLARVEGVHAAARDDGDVDADGCRGLAERLVASLAKRPADLLHLSRYPDYDSYTLGHSVRVAILATLVGHRLGYAREMLVEIGTAALLHDAGKGKIPREILYKRGPLDADERQVMATHSVLGAEVLLRNVATGPLSVAAAYGHHMRHDRRGYPLAHGWVRISPVTSLIQVCDIFEALTATRPYKPALSPRRAYEIMLSDPGAIHPAAFSSLFYTLGLYPPGSRVRLSSGAEAFVLNSTSDPERPVVQLTHDPSGAALAEGDRRTLDLASHEGAGTSVERILSDDVRHVDADPKDYAERSLTIVTHDAAEVAAAAHAHADPCASGG